MKLRLSSSKQTQKKSFCLSEKEKKAIFMKKQFLVKKYCKKSAEIVECEIILVQKFQCFDYLASFMPRLRHCRKNYVQNTVKEISEKFLKFGQF